MKFYLNFSPVSFHGEIRDEHIVKFDFAQSPQPEEFVFQVSPSGDLSAIGAAHSKTDVTRSSASDLELNLISRVAHQLSEYFNGKRKSFELPLRFIEGTEFQQTVWKHLQNIPYGKTKSYSTFAHEINKPLAVRAVGGAIGKNPFGLLIPCHRVIGKDGSLTGFAGGVPTKKVLLDLEKQFA